MSDTLPRTPPSSGSDGPAVRLPRPIFVVGCQRSGTTMLRLVLDSHSAISCGPETRFLADMERIVGQDWERLSRYGFTKEEWLGRMAEFFGGIQSDYAVRRGKRRWADKTPLYALNIDLLTSMFPDCQIVNMTRDGRDVVVSHRKRFGYWSSVKSTIKWPKYITAGDVARAKLPPEQFYDLRYEDVVGDAEPTLRSLFDWLGEEWEPAVLQYEKHEHDVPSKYSDETKRRRESGSTDASFYRSSVGSFRREADPVTKVMFFLFARRTLKRLGYPT